MGGEIAQEREWSHDREVDWALLDDPAHRGVQRLVRDLNRAYRDEPALHGGDADPAGFEWIVGDDRDHGVFIFLRRAAGAAPVLVVVNMTPTPRHGYRVGVPQGGRWREILNSDATGYGGSGVGNGGSIDAETVPSHGRAESLAFAVPPLATLMLRADAVAA
jgi:1,4-alpha-glucan branching enzyme